jgi:hypothetical protein
LSSGYGAKHISAESLDPAAAKSGREKEEAEEERREIDGEASLPA